MKEVRMDGFLVRRLTLEEILSIYREISVRHFPADELKPEASLLALYEAGAYEGLALFKYGVLVAYAFFAKVPGNENVLLLDYYAVLEEFRNCGAGSRFLQAMKTYYANKDAILLETEQPDKAQSPEERLVREHRNAFYERNGCRKTRVWSRLFSVDFGIFVMPLTQMLSDRQVYEKLNAIYQFIFQGIQCEKHVKIGFEP